MATVNDTLPTQPLGGQETWTGEVDLVAIATSADTDPDPTIDDSVPTPTDEMTGSCDLRKNGNLVATVLGPVTGTGVVEAHDVQFTFTALEDDVMSICTDVTVAGYPHYVCTDAGTPVSLEPVWELSLFELLNDSLTYLVFYPLDVAVCDGLIALAPTLNSIDPTIAFIHSDGDLDLFETPFWDCPPYSTATGPRAGHLTAKCTHRKTGVVVGRAVTNGASSVTLRCVVKVGSVVYFDEERRASGSTVSLEAVAPNPPGTVTVCTYSSGTWFDGETTSYEGCQESG